MSTLILQSTTMSKITILFWILLTLFLYKLTFLEQSQPDTQHQFSIARDQHGIPHIYGKQYEAIFYGIGYAEAEDRLWSMFFKKLMVQGRTAEVFGADSVPTDLEMRNMGYHQIGKMNKNHTDPQTMRYLQVYCDGINAYARTVKMLPFQFYLFWVDWEQFKPEDSISSIYFLSFLLEFDWFYEVARQRLLQTVGFDVANKLIHFGNNLFRQVTIVSDDELKKKGLYEKYDYNKQKQILIEHWLKKNMSLGSLNLPHLTGGVEGTGSNAWVIGGEHTFNGKAILANDPHVVSLIPNMFYHFQMVKLNKDNQIHSRKFGVMAEGIPSLSMGVTEIAAWGSTSAYIDNKDVYYETVRNQSGIMQYKFKDEWHNFRQRKELIKVRGGKDIEQIFYHTHRGVVIESIFMDLHWKYGYPLPKQYKDNHTLTLVASHFKPDNSTMRGMIRTLLLQTQEDFLEINSNLIHPNIDCAFILKNGTYGYSPTGGIPKRKIPEMGSFIKDGNSDQYDFQEDLASSEKIILFDSKKGYFSMANNKFASNNYKHRSSIHQLTTGRSLSINRMIQKKIKSNTKFDFETMKQMQLSLKDQYLCQVWPQFVGKIGQFKKIWSNPQTEALMEKFIDWDCVMNKDSVQAGIYHVFQQLFHDSLLTMTSLSEHQRKSIISHAFFQNYYFNLLQSFNQGKLTEQDKIVCQSLETNKYPNVHSCEAALAVAFRKLPQQLKQDFGSQNIEEYKWGKIHRQFYTILPFSQIPGLNKIFHRSFPTGGNSRTPNVAIFTHQAKGYTSFASPAFRFMTDLNTTFYSIETGTSDRILSPFFDHFMGKNQYLEYIPCNPYQDGLPEGWHFTIQKLK